MSERLEGGEGREGEARRREAEEKTLAKEEAESLMIFLITPARGERKEGPGRGAKGVDDGEERERVGKEREGGEIETAPPYRAYPVLIRTDHPPPPPTRPPRPWFSHKKY